MKKFFVKCIATIMMCAIVFSAVAISASAGTIVSYSDTKGPYFSGALKGDIDSTIGESRVIAKTTRKTGGSGYAYTYVKAYFEYPDGEYYPVWDVTSSSSITVSLNDPGYIYTPDGVSSLHTIYDGPDASIIQSTPGYMWLGDHTH